MTKMLPIMEIFGPTIQGEGMVIGRKTMFVRVAGCDYRCAWCDSAFTWDGSEKARLQSPEDIWMELVREAGYRNFNHVTISGGNPALYGDAMQQFIGICHRNEVAVGLETQGSIWQDWFLHIDDLTISPKPPSSGMETDWDILDGIIHRLETNSVNFSLKVVIFDDIDFEYAKKVHERYGTEDFYVSVGNPQPNAVSLNLPNLLRRLEWLWDKVLADPDCNSWRPLPQLHTLVWGNKRGV